MESGGPLLFAPLPSLLFPSSLHLPFNSHSLPPSLEVSPINSAREPRSAVSFLLHGVWDGAPAEIEFGAF